PGDARRACRPGPECAGPSHPRPPARHYHRGRHLRWGSGAGRRPPGHRREHDREAGRGEGLPQRRVLRHGLRGHRERGDRVRPPVPGRARALREDGRPVAVPGGEGEPAGLHGPREPGRGHGRIFSYDVAGGPYEEHRFYSIGSGSLFARGALKKLYADGMPAGDAVLACVQALYDAADDDSATGGPDLPRRIFPVVATITADGFRKLPEAEAAQVAEQVIRERLANPDGPPAALRNG